MTPCPWEPIDEFQSRAEFERFVAWLDTQTAQGDVQEVPVGRPYLEATTFEERWFRHGPSNTTWRLVWPDGPFTGLFEQVM